MYMAKKYIPLSIFARKKIYDQLFSLSLDLDIHALAFAWRGRSNENISTVKKITFSFSHLSLVTLDEF